MSASELLGGRIIDASWSRLREYYYFTAGASTKDDTCVTVNYTVSSGADSTFTPGSVSEGGQISTIDRPV